MLWGFGDRSRIGIGSDGGLWGARLLWCSMGFADFPTKCVVDERLERRLCLRSIDLRRALGPHAVWRAVEVPVGIVWRAGCHMAGLALTGGALGCCCGGNVSTMINCPPQHGQGIASTWGWSSVLSARSSVL